MILHRDHVVIEGGLYRLCESAFVDVQLRPNGKKDCLLYPYVIVKDALGTVLGKSIGAQPFPLADLALATASSLPIDLEREPNTFSSDHDCLEPWLNRSLERRAIVWLLTVYGWAQSRRIQKISYLELMLRTLDHASGVQVNFRMKADRVTEIVINFGRLENSGFVVSATPDGQYDIVASSFVPISETCET